MDGGKGVQDFVSLLRDCEDPFSQFQTFIEKRGGKGYFYGFACMKSDIAEFNLSSALFSHDTYGTMWKENSTTENAIDNDSTTARLLAGEDYIEWVPEDFLVHEQMLTSKQYSQVYTEYEMGIKYGCSIAIERSEIGLSGMGFWTTAVTSGENFRRLWARYGQEISQGATVLDLHVRNDRPNLLVGLTAREIDCVSWLAAGLRPSEICWKLKISEKTFEKHILRSKIKLKARTRDNAVAKAILFGLIRF